MTASDLAVSCDSHRLYLTALALNLRKHTPPTSIGARPPRCRFFPRLRRDPRHLRAVIVAAAGDRVGVRF
jgi:hypothetical protein